MRNVILAVLLATSAALPAMAQDRGERDRGAQGAATDQGDEARAARRAQRAERMEGERPQRQERADGGRAQGDERGNWAARSEARQQAAQQQNADQQVVRQRGFEQRDGGRGWGQRRSNDDGMAAAIERQQSAERARAQSQTILQQRDGQRDGWRDGRGDGRSNDGSMLGRMIDRGQVRTNGDAAQRDNHYRNGGDRYDRRHGHNDRQWSNHWRGDRNYDWRNYRNRNRSVFRLGNYWDPYGSHYRRFSIGFSLFPNYYQSNNWLRDPWMYRLPPAYGPYRWVRYYDDALLVNIYTGQVVDVEYNFFW